MIAFLKPCRQCPKLITTTYQDVRRGHVVIMTFFGCELSTHSKDDLIAEEYTDGTAIYHKMHLPDNCEMYLEQWACNQEFEGIVDET